MCGARCSAGSRKSGKFHADTAGILGVLVYVIQEQGRYQEAERLQRQVIEHLPGTWDTASNPRRW